jgi:hypothetical protein
VVRHERVLAELFARVLGLCDGAGLVSGGVIAIAGTRLAGNASKDRNREFAKIAREILGEAKVTDQAEDRQRGEAGGDELPEELRTVEGRRAFLRDVRMRPGPMVVRVSWWLAAVRRVARALMLRRQAAALVMLCRVRGCRTGRIPIATCQGPRRLTRSNRTKRSSSPRQGSGPCQSAPEYVFDTKRIVARGQGREGWPREARRQLEEHRFTHPQPVPRSRSERLLIAAERLEEDLEADRRANEAYQHYKATGRKSDGRRFGRAPNPYMPPEVPEGKVNITDPDSHYMKTNDGYVQGYNAQAVVSEQQIVLAADITTSTVDWSQLDPMVGAAIAELEQAGVSDGPRVALADCQYWNEEHMDEVVANKHIQVLIPPESQARAEPRAGSTGGRYDYMRAVLKSEAGQQLYHKRPGMIEPLFAQTKHNRGVTRFLRRGGRRYAPNGDY